MKLLLLKLVLSFTAVLAAPADKQKRNILPGDPRYGTEHSPHEHHEHENEVQILKAAGGYVGSYTVPDDTVPEDHSFQVQSSSSYGPPNHTPSEPLGTDFLASSDIDKTPASVLVPSTSYGIPDTTQILNNYLGPVADDKSPAVIKTTIQEQPKYDTVHVKTVDSEDQHEVHNVQQPAVVQEQNIPQTVSLPQAKVTASHISTATQDARNVASSFSIPSHISYSSSYSNIPVKTVDHHVRVQVPQPYHVPVTKHVAVPIPVPHTVDVPKPYYIRVPQPVQVAVNRPYPVEVARPVPYPVPHYVRTNVPVAQQVAVDIPVPQYVRTGVPIAQPVAAIHRDNPLQTFFDNTQFQNVLSSVPTFSNPLEGFHNPLENIDLSSYPPLSFIPSSISSSIPFLPQPAQTPAAGDNINVPSSTNNDSVAVDNPVLKTTITKPAIVKPAIKTHSQTYKPSTACAGCIVSSSSSKQEYVQPTDANGGYVY